MPNLLFLYTDEQRYDTMAAYGNRRIETPHLDRLAARSTVFEQTYVTQPVCTPSRSSLLTGLYPHTTGLVENNIPLPQDVPCVPEMLEAGRWFCAHHGKWHLGDEIFAQHGFEEWRATEDTYHAYYRPERDQAERSAYHHWLAERGQKPVPRPELPPDIADRFFRPQIHRFPEAHSRPMFLSEGATRFIRENRGREWVLYVNFLEPHMPFYCCRDDQYDPAEVIVPDNFEFPGPGATCKARAAAATYAEKGFEGQPLADEAGWRELIARYWGLCSLVDTHVGRILAALEETDQDDDTIVVFTSDHGDLMGSHRLLGKGHQYEESTRVPMTVRLPGQTDGRRVSGPVSQIDLVPTLLDLMGQTPPDRLQGTSLRPLLEHGGRADQDVVIEWTREETWKQPHAADKISAAEREACSAEAVAVSRAANIRTVVTPDGWKLNWSTAGEHELYDLSTDPLERKNLVADPDQAGRIGDLLDRIKRWQERTEDAVDLPAAV